MGNYISIICANVVSRLRGHIKPGFPRPMVLNIGGRKYSTEPATLTDRSNYFKNQMISRFQPWKPEPDGSYFVDADPDLFCHLLRYMRRPEVFPVFYDETKGFDYDLYKWLEAEARYFQLDELETWVADKCYLQAVTHSNILTIQSIEQAVSTSDNANVFNDWQFIPRVRKLYVCPRNIQVHRGDRTKCGKACREARGIAAEQYDEELFTDDAIVKRAVVFDQHTCRPDI